MSLDISSYPTLAPLEYERERIGWNLPIRHWSPSSFDELLRCPHRWQQIYIQKHRKRPAEAPLLGLAVHKGLEMNFVQKIESHEDLPIAQALEYYGDVFPAIVELEQEKTGEEVEWDTSLEQARTRGNAMLAAYLNNVAPRVQPLAVELFVSVDFGLPVPVEGRADIETEPKILDWKTGERASRKPKESWLIQAAVYSQARSKPVEFQSLTATKAKNAVTLVTSLEEPGLHVDPTPAEREQQVRIMEDLSDMACFYMAKYGPDEPWPVLGRFHQWACDKCSFRGICPAWSEQ